jgi:hypothetical protein
MPPVRRHYAPIAAVFSSLIMADHASRAPPVTSRAAGVLFKNTKFFLQNLKVAC